MTLSRVRSSALRPLAVVVAAVAGGAVVLWGDPTTPGGPLPECPSNSLFGLVCPGCGSLRMIYSLLHGDVPAALHYNALALAALPLILWSAAVWMSRPWRVRTAMDWTRWRWAPILSAVVLAGWFVLRNLPFMPFTALRV